MFRPLCLYNSNVEPCLKLTHSNLNYNITISQSIKNVLMVWHSKFTLQKICNNYESKAWQWNTAAKDGYIFGFHCYLDFWNCMQLQYLHPWPCVMSREAMTPNILPLTKCLLCLFTQRKETSYFCLSTEREPNHNFLAGGFKQRAKRATCWRSKDILC